MLDQTYSYLYFWQHLKQEKTDLNYIFHKLLKINRNNKLLIKEWNKLVESKLVDK